jgi:hypothetical protein
MYKFALHKIEQVKGKISFFKLEVDGKCEFDEFCKMMEGTGKRKELSSMLAIMDSAANLRIMPKTRYRELKGRKKADKTKDYEVKKDEFRIYLFKIDEGNVVVFGSFKSKQKEDILRLRRIKREFITSKKS